MQVSKSPRLTVLALAIGILTFALYLPTLWSGFVYDAEAQIEVDDYIHQPANFFEVVTFRVLSRDVLDYNRPVQLASLMIDSMVWGKNPFGYHLTSNMLHALNAAMVFLLVVKLASAVAADPGRPVLLAAAIGALFFAFHPVNVEAVAEVSSREDLLATFFVLAGLLVATTGRGVWSGVGAVVAFLLACASKETGIAGPFLLGIYWLIFRRDEPGKRWAVLIGASFLVALAFLSARFYFQPPVSHIFTKPPQYLGGSLAKVFEIQPRLWTFQLTCLFWPFGLAADYVPQNVAWISLPAGLVSLAVLLAVQGLLGWKSRVALFGAAIFWLGLAPVSNFLPMYRPLADRFLYLPIVGVAVSLGGLLLLAVARREIFGPALVVCAIGLMPLAALTWQRQAVFSSPLNLWQDTVAKSPLSDTAASNLGYALLDAGSYEESLNYFYRAVKLTNGGNDNALAGSALAFEKLGRPDKAEAALLEAIAVNPLNASPPKLLEALMTDPERAAVLQQINDRLNQRRP
ncbi:MAG: tetratricopeptide repeat protein [Terrimicrobiaceae bacterium]